VLTSKTLRQVGVMVWHSTRSFINTGRIQQQYLLHVLPESYSLTLVFFSRPDLIDYASLKPSQHEANLNNAFNVAEERLGITRLLDVEGT
jgi:hypothetical protein